MCSSRTDVSQEDNRWFFPRAALPIIILLIFCLLGAAPAGPGGGVPNEDIVRFHVRAHSNDPYDQEIKNYLASNLLQVFGPRWNGCASSRQLRELLERDKKMIRETAAMILEEKGIHDPVEVEFAKHIFPARFYGDRFYPPGEYASLIIEIGSGQGENWWCVLFPPLCFTVFPAPGKTVGPLSEKAAGNPAPDLCTGEAPPRPVTPPLQEKKGRWRFWIVEFSAKLFCNGKNEEDPGAK